MSTIGAIALHGEGARDSAPGVIVRVSYAEDPAKSRGREFAHDAVSLRGPRSAFQRDRDRVIHSIAFRRLRHKTQVFIAPDGDHYRVRLTHSLEVAQIGRVIARALELDEDLTEALCLAHDIGHPPFGHAGEEALEEAMVAYGGFDHNAQTLRTLMRLESPYCTHDGLNLSWEVLEGLAKHNGPVARPAWALAELDKAYPFDLATWPSAEAQVAALADDIAYDNHDIDDGLRSGYLALDQLLGLDFVADLWRSVEKRFPGAPRDRQLRELVRSQIGLMVNDCIETARANLADMDSPDDVRGAGRASVCFSAGMERQERELKRFMFAELYNHPRQVETAARAQQVVVALFGAYRDDRGHLPAEWAAALPAEEPGHARHIADFIAGMTDRFALNEHQRIFGHAPSGLSNV